jgi:uncharacterized protein YuzE
MEGTYDSEVDAAYLRLVPELMPGASKWQVRVRDDHIRGDVVLDLDENGQLLGIEVLDASQVLRPETISALSKIA